MVCFIASAASHNAISENASFHCDPLNKTQFLDNFTNATALCFRCGPSLQMMKNVLDQLSICTSLLSLFSTLLVVIVCLGRTAIELILSIVLVGYCGAAEILVAYLKVSFSPLIYAVLSLGIGLGFFRVLYFIILIRINNNKKKNGSEAKPPPPDTESAFETTNRKNNG